MAIDYNTLVVKPTGAGVPKSSGIDYNKLVVSRKNVAPVVTTPPVPAAEPDKNIFQKASKLAGDFAMGIFSPVIKSAELTWQGAKTTGKVLKAGGQLALGNEAGAKQTVVDEGNRLMQERSQPMKVFGRDVERTMTPKQAAGLALEVASYGIGAGEALAAKNILKTSLTQGFKMGAKKVGERTAYGALAGGMFSGGVAMEENKNAKQIATEAVKGAAIGAIFEIGMIGVGAGASAARKSITNIMRDIHPQDELGRLAMKQGEELVPRKLKVGEVVTNEKDPLVSYQKAVNLGRDEQGERILARTEINETTGEAKIFIDKSLDRFPAKKGLVMEHEAQKIVDFRLNKKAKEAAQETRLSGLQKKFEESQGGQKLLAEPKKTEMLMLEAPKKGAPIVGEGFTMTGGVDLNNVKRAKAVAAYQKALAVYNRNATKENLSKLLALKDKVKALEVKPVTVLDKSLRDLGLRLGKTKEEIKTALVRDLKKVGGFEAGQAKYADNPAAVKQETPTFATLMEHQTDPNVTIHTTSATDVIGNIERRVDETKAKVGAKMPKTKTPKSETYTPTASKRIEAELQAKKLIKEIDDLPEVDRVHIKDQAMEYGAISADKKVIEDILFNGAEAPGKLKASSVWRFESEKAALEGNVARQIELAKSPLAEQFSKEGANIAMLRGMNRYNPVNLIKKINALKNEKFKKSGKVNKLEGELRNIKKRVSPTKENWSSFIDSISCK
jgi:hypothetical protein